LKIFAPDGNQPNQAGEFDRCAAASHQRNRAGQTWHHGRYCATSGQDLAPLLQFWMGLQDEYELREARSAIEDQLERMMPIAA